jgi:hypothetical protein
LRESISADEGGELSLDLDLEPLARTIGVDRYAVDEDAEALHQRPTVVLGLGVLSNASGSPTSARVFASVPPSG